ncbi:nitroreductase family protein [Szabonella alba]|uniref:Putative NAD(P)H nitroreductase n=1 Tax=Szabonella alba TaxID=2804194 RepID=A0A8K0XYA3_9RHOB|nr:nitroreductase [Szabonella alba]MBL4915840.1 nitroreductase [Szabonella alba]
MPDPRPDVTDFLRRRRSVPPKLLRAPVPDRDQVAQLLEQAARSPDHGKLEPWRFLVLEQGAMARLAGLAGEKARIAGLDPEAEAKARSQFDAGLLAVVVIASPKDSDKVPAIEQTLSVGAVCLALVNSALAAGWGAGWLTGWAAHDRGFVEEGLVLAPQEFVAGIIHIATAPGPMTDRPRPDVAALTRWMAT